MKDPLSKDGPSTSPAWVARKEACEGAIKKLKRISGKTMPQKAAVAFLRNYIEGCNGFIENKMPASGNRKFGITDNAIVAGAGVLGLEVVKEPIFRMRYPPEVFTLAFDDPEKRLDLLVHRKGTRNRYVAIECKSTSDFNNVAAALMEFHLVRKLGAHVYLDKNRRESMRAKPQDAHFIFVSALGNQGIGWFEIMSETLFPGNRTRKPVMVELHRKVRHRAEPLRDAVVRLFKEIDDHLRVKDK